VRVTQEIDIEKICKQYFVVLIANATLNPHRSAHKTPHSRSRAVGARRR
jgi:hypothetical protein